MRIHWALIVFISFAAAVASLEAWMLTRPGIGISPDSIVYMASARSLSSGHGFTMPAANGHDVPLTHFPPGYPLVLAFVTYLFGQNMFLAAKWLNILLFGANTALVVGWFYRSTRKLIPVVFVALMSLSAVDLLRVYSMAWSEPFFLFLTFGGLFLLDRYLSTGSRTLLVSAAACTAAAALTRYAGIAEIGAGIIVLIVCQKKLRIRRWQEPAQFGFIAGLPLALWLLRNRLLTHDATTRKFVYHPVWGEIRLAFQNTAALWLGQSRLPPFSAVCLCMVLVTGGLAAWYRFKKRSELPSAFWVLFIFSLSYLVLMTLIIFFLEAQLLNADEYDRILCPLHSALLLTIVLALSHAEWPRVLRRLAEAAGILVGGWFVFAGVQNINVLSQDGQQFAGAAWRESPTIDYVRRLPATMHVYTNGRMPIYLYANRSCYEFPPKTLLSSMEPNTDYRNTMEKIGVEVRSGIAVVAGFTIEDLPQFASPVEWETLLHKAPFKTVDGYIFRS